MTIKASIQKRVCDMARSLLDEEYRIMVKVPLPDSYFCKLRHLYNGNTITIIGNYKTMEVRLLRNGKERHREMINE